MTEPPTNGVRDPLDGHVRWFGRHWGAPVCDDTEPVPTPEGEPCSLCREPIQASDDGFLILHMSATSSARASLEGQAKMRPVHYACEMRHLGLPLVRRR